MAFYKEDIVDINLNTGNIFRSFLGHSIGYKDDDADRFGIRAFRDGVPVDLSGASCQAIFMNPNGTNIALTSYGTVSGNVAYVTLPPACYDYEGQFCLAIKLVGDGVTGTVRIVDGTVTRTGASGAVAPTSSVPTYQEILSTYDAMVAATSAANLAIAETFDATKAYPAGKYVINEGHLYRLTADHAANVTWANTSKVATNFGDDLSSLKSALIDNDIIKTLSFVSGYVNQSGEIAQSSTHYYSDLIHVEAGERYHIHGFESNVLWVAFYETSLSNADAVKSITGTSEVTDLDFSIPSNITYMRVCYHKTYGKPTLFKRTTLTGYATETQLANESNRINTIIEDTQKMIPNLFVGSVTIEDDWTTNRLLDQNGNIISQGVQKYALSDYIKTSKYESFRAFQTQYDSETFSVYIGIYDSNKDFIKRETLCGINVDNIVQMVNNAKYIRICIGLTESNITQSIAQSIAETIALFNYASILENSSFVNIADLANTTDDILPIINRIIANGKIAFIPPGNWKVSSFINLTSGGIVGVRSASKITYTGSLSESYLITIAANSIMLRDFIIDCDNKCNGIHLASPSANRAGIQGIQVRYAYKRCYFFDKDYPGTIITDCLAIGMNDGDKIIKSQYGFFITAHDCRLNNCTAYGCKIGIYCGGGSGLICESVKSFYNIVPLYLNSIEHNLISMQIEENIGGAYLRKCGSSNIKIQSDGEGIEDTDEMQQITENNDYGKFENPIHSNEIENVAVLTIEDCCANNIELSAYTRTSLPNGKTYERIVLQSVGSANAQNNIFITHKRNSAYDNEDGYPVTNTGDINNNFLLVNGGIIS